MNLLIGVILMGLFDDVLNKVTDTGNKVSDQAKLKIKQHNLEQALRKIQDQINDRLMLIGAAVVDALENGNELSSFDEERAELRELLEKQMDIQNQLNMLVDTAIRCESCGGLMDKSNEYCPHCGQKRAM